MRTHLASVTTFLGIAVVAAGCGGHTASREFGALPSSPAQATPAAPPVVVAEPAPSKAKPAAPAAAVLTDPATAKKLANTQKLNKHLRHQHKLEQRKLHHQRAAAAKARKQAAAREQRLRDELAAAKSPAPASHPRHHAKPSAPISASDVPADDAQRGARVTVVRFHDLLNARNASACDLLSVRFLRDHFPGDDSAAQRASCASGVTGLSSRVSVLVQSSGLEADGAWVRVVSRFGDQSRPQVMHLVPFAKAWMIDSVESIPSR